MNGPYPAPDRSNFEPNQFTGDPVMPERDRGALVGELSDTRPYRGEVWCMEGSEFVTLFFSTVDLEEATASDLLPLIEPVLFELGIKARWRALGQWNVTTIRDGSDQPMYSLTFVAVDGWMS